MHILESAAFRVAILVALTGLVGCKPKIGDACTIASDCSSAGDRLCDTTQPGGYCTAFNCAPGTCPQEAMCVAFEDATCFHGEADLARLRRTFCMATCSTSSDCRVGYLCEDIRTSESRIPHEDNLSRTKVCLVAATLLNDGGTSGPDAAPQVCAASDGAILFESRDARAFSDASDAADVSDEPDATDASSDLGQSDGSSVEDTTFSDAPFDASAWSDSADADDARDGNGAGDAGVPAEAADLGG